MSRRSVLFVVLFVALAPAALADPLPTQVGQCTQTTIARIEHRLQGMPQSGSAVGFANRGYQVSYDTVPAIVHSRVGDPVRMCLVKIPRGCPPGDNRGREYATTNLHP